MAEMTFEHEKSVRKNGPKRAVEFHVLLALAHRANPDGQCWPSVRKIAEDTRYKERAVRNALRNLERDGWIMTDARKATKCVNLYTILTPAPDAGAGNAARHLMPPTPAPDAEQPRHLMPLNQPIKNHEPCEPDSQGSGSNKLSLAAETMLRRWKENPEFDDPKPGKAA